MDTKDTLSITNKRTSNLEITNEQDIEINDELPLRNETPTENYKSIQTTDFKDSAIIPLRSIRQYTKVKDLLLNGNLNT